MTTPPKLKITGQYLKDLSLESPLSPGILVSMPKDPPKISVEFDIMSSKIGVDDKGGETEVNYYEVVMHVTAKALIEENKPAFVCDIRYGSVVSVETLKGDSDNEAVKHSLLVKVPAMLFPFAREIIAGSTSAAGFPPLMLDPVDFEATYADNVNKTKTNSAKQ